MIMAEVERIGGTTSVLQLARAAQRKAREEDLCERWQWEAMQHLMYGGQFYSSLLLGLPLCLDVYEHERAATMLQHIWKQRLARQALLARRMYLQQKEQEALAKQLYAWNTAASAIQRVSRGRRLRQARSSACHCGGAGSVALEVDGTRQWL